MEDRFADLATNNRAGFIPYIMAGDPDPGATLALLHGLAGAGADIIEIGAPFSDPVADGPTIQRAAARALAGGMTLEGVLSLAAAFRDQDSSTPLVLMGYLNPLLARGLERFAGDAAASGIDGVIVVDCPPEESGPLLAALEAHEVALIRLATPTSDDERLTRLAAGGRGFLYYVSVAGVTGAAAGEVETIAAAVARARAIARLPVAVGFGIRALEQAKAVARVADAVVVGSALVGILEGGRGQGENVTATLLEAARMLANAIHGARASAPA